MKQSILVLAGLVSILLIVVAIKSRVELNKKNDLLEANYQTVLQDYISGLNLLRQGNVSDANELLFGANIYLLSDEESEHKTLKSEIELLRADILNIQSLKFLKKSYYDLSNSQYEGLKIHDFSRLPSYTFNHVADSIFKEIMFDNLSNYASYTKEIEEEKQKQAQREIENESYTRKAYATQLRNAFLDAGFNIKVKVTGKYNTNLTLTYSLFDEVWTRKFSKEGRISEWHNMGFQRVYFKNGYDFNVYYQK